MLLFAMAVGALVDAGAWDEALDRVVEVRRSPDVSGAWLSRLIPAMQIHVEQGRLDLAHELLEACASLEHSEEVQSRTWFSWCRAMVLRGEGSYEEALAAAEMAASARQEIGAGSLGVKRGLIEQIEAATVVDPSQAEELVSRLEQLPPGETSPLLAAQAVRFRARLSAGAAGDQKFSAATAAFRALSTPFWLAVVLLEHGELLVSLGRSDDAARLLTEAREIFERLYARPWLDRLDRTTSDETISA